MTRQMNIDVVDGAALEWLRDIGRAPYLPKQDRAIWLQVYDRIGDACLSGPLIPGSRLPGEFDLAELFSVSRLTMRKALSKLQQEGQLQARKGVGIFVRRSRTSYTVDDDLRFSQSLEADADSIETRTLELTRVPADKQSAAWLAIDEGTEIIRLSRLRIVDGAPIYLAAKDFPADKFENFEAAFAPAQSVTDVYRAHGIDHHMRGETRVNGKFANRTEAEALQVTHRTPLLQVISVNLSPTGTPIEYNRGRWVFSAVELVFGARHASVVSRSAGFGC